MGVLSRFKHNRSPSAYVLFIKVTKLYQNEKFMIRHVLVKDTNDSRKQNYCHTYMTVGFSRPVNFTNPEICKATWMISSNAFSGSSEQQDASGWYFSTYIRIVAPCEPVPERRNMMRESSLKTMRIPYAWQKGMLYNREINQTDYTWWLELENTNVKSQNNKRHFLEILPDFWKCYGQ